MGTSIWPRRRRGGRLPAHRSGYGVVVAERPGIDRLDTDAIARVLAAAVGGRPVRSIRHAPGGYSNDMRRVDVGRPAASFALRVHRQGARACAVEAALAALVGGTGVPVPDVVWIDPGGAVAGLPISLWTWSPGVPLDTALPIVDAPYGARCLGHAVGRTLAGIGENCFACNGFFTGVDDTGAVIVNDALASDDPGVSLVGYVEDRLGHSGDELVRCYADLVCREAPALRPSRGRPRLVHADFNPKNLLVERGGVSAVLDWEFAFAGSPLTDVANMLRHADTYPAGYTDGFIAGFRDGGGDLEPGWERQARLLDVFALVDFLAADPPRPLTAGARQLAARCVRRGWI